MQRGQCLGGRCWVQSRSWTCGGSPLSALGCHLHAFHPKLSASWSRYRTRRRHGGNSLRIEEQLWGSRMMMLSWGRWRAERLEHHFQENPFLLESPQRWESVWLSHWTLLSCWCLSRPAGVDRRQSNHRCVGIAIPKVTLSQTVPVALVQAGCQGWREEHIEEGRRGTVQAIL